MRVVPIRLFAFFFITALVTPGCNTERKRLSPVEKARLIQENRKEARDLLARYRASGDDLNLLKEYKDLHKENTEIAPATCPRCWAEYGEALSMIGWVWWNSYQDVLRELEEKKKAGATPSKLRELEDEASTNRDEWVRYFTASNRAYETHFRQVVAIHPYSYERVMRHYEILGDFDQALYYLDMTMKAYREFFQEKLDARTRRKFDQLRKLYTRERERMKEMEVRGERQPLTPKAPSESISPPPGLDGLDRE